MNSTLETNNKYTATPKIGKFFLIGYFFSLCFDFKQMGSNIGASSFQIIMTLSSLIFAGLYYHMEMIMLPAPKKMNRNLSKVNAAWWLWLFSTLVLAVATHVNFRIYLKVLLPFFLCGVSLFLVLSIKRQQRNPNFVMGLMFVSCIVSLIWRFTYAIFIAGLDFEFIRWQILSPGIHVLLGISIAKLIFTEKKFLGSISLILTFPVIIFSVTRAYLISLFFIAFGVLIIFFKSKNWSITKFILTTIRKSWIYLIVIVLIVSITSYFKPGIFTLWGLRIFHHTTDTGYDYTYLTRLAELSGQWQALSKNIMTLLFGNGIGSFYFWDKNFLVDIPFILPQSETGQFVAGHSTWMYFWYSSGLTIGSIPIILMMYFFLKGYKNITFLSKTNDKFKPSISLFLISFSWFGSSFTGNLFGERYGGLLIGIVFGLILLYYETKSNSTKEETRKGAQ